MIVLYMGNGFARGRVTYTGCYENVLDTKETTVVRSYIHVHKYIFSFKLYFYF